MSSSGAGKRGWQVMVLGASTLMACAAGRIRPDGSIEGIAIGHAELRICHMEAAVNQCAVFGEDDTALACQQIRGGALSIGFAEFLSNVATAVGAWFGIAP